MYDYYIIGGGPAGVATAYYLTRHGFKVKLVEGRKAVGEKPCGGGVPPSLQEYLPIPKDSIFNSIKSMKISYEFEELGSWSPGTTLFYMIDRRKYLEEYLPSFDHELGKFAKVTTNGAIIDGEKIEAEKVIVATGALWRFKERKMVANTVQYVIEGVRVEDSTEIEFIFFHDLIGYAWIFPYSERTVKVGIGGLNKNVNELENMLKLVVEKKGFDEGRIVKREGAPIDMGGIKAEWASETPYAVGEAIGAVMPLTGEGIRPSIMTAKVLAQALSNDKYKYDELLRKLPIFKPSGQQRKILIELMNRGHVPSPGKLSPKAISLIYKFGLGEAKLKDFLTVLPSSFSIIKLLFK